MYTSWLFYGMVIRCSAISMQNKKLLVCVGRFSRIKPMPYNFIAQSQWHVCMDMQFRIVLNRSDRSETLLLASSASFAEIFAPKISLCERIVFRNIVCQTQETSCHTVSISIIIRTPALIRSLWHQKTWKATTTEDDDAVDANNENEKNVNQIVV